MNENHYIRFKFLHQSSSRISYTGLHHYFRWKPSTVIHWKARLQDCQRMLVFNKFCYRPEIESSSSCNASDVLFLRLVSQLSQVCCWSLVERASRLAVLLSSSADKLSAHSLCPWALLCPANDYNIIIFIVIVVVIIADSYVLLSEGLHQTVTVLDLGTLRFKINSKDSMSCIDWKQHCIAWYSVWRWLPILLEGDL